jgi:Meiotically up-regulated gene 113
MVDTAMDKQFIISEIHRTAKNGKAIGQTAFTTETGIKIHQWHGKYWARWGDALVEAGFPENEWNSAHEEKDVIEGLLRLARKLGKFPAKGEIGLAHNTEPTSPTYKAVSRLGTRAELKDKLLKYCSAKSEFADLKEIILSISVKDSVTPISIAELTEVTNGYVYLVSAQEAYKIGSTRAPYRRVAEIANQSAKGAELLHLISTDDPEGIEKYWHRRFDEKRITGLNKQSGEWFALSSEEIKAFKRRKTM